MDFNPSFAIGTQSFAIGTQFCHFETREISARNSTKIGNFAYLATCGDFSSVGIRRLLRERKRFRIKKTVNCLTVFFFNATKFQSNDNSKFFKF